MSQKTARKLRRRSNEETDLKLMKKDPGQSEEVIAQIGDATDDDDLKGFSTDGTNGNVLNGAESSHIESLAVETVPQINMESEATITEQDQIEQNTGENKKNTEKQEGKVEENENKVAGNENTLEENKNQEINLEQKELAKEEEKKTVKSPVLDNQDENDDGENQEELEKLTLVEEDIDEKSTIIESKNGKSEATPEPPVLESEEPDPELQFDENSDVESRKGSPVIRCKTRRSLTRNIPTPKTPKSLLDVNGDEKNSEYSDKQSIVTVLTPEITDTESEVSSFRAVTDIETKSFALRSVNADDFINNMDETLSLSNISTKAVVGSELTRDDLSYNLEDDCSSFLDMTKDKSVGETLRNLSSRRSIRPAKDYHKLTHQLNNQRQYNNLHFQSRQSMERVPGLKRKHRSCTPDNGKRFKTEPSGFMSYISSPITSFKHLFAKSDLPSSTPKLTGYKNKSVFENPSNSKMNLDATAAAEDAVEKKGGCILM